MDKQSIKISAITVVFNGARTLQACIDSIAAQTHPDVEHIIIDGGSRDGTVDILERNAARLAHFVSEPDFGIYHAMNKGLAAATGDYVVFLGADDVLYPEALSWVVETCLSGQAQPDFIVAAVDAGDIVVSGYRPERHWLGAKACVTHHSVGMLVKRCVMNELGGFSMKYPQCADGFLIKTLVCGPYVGVGSDVVMGRFDLGGVSNQHVARGLVEGYLVQLDTGEHRLLQFLIFFARLLKNLPRLARR